jgi:predicted GNAT family acetyltransferase
MKPVIRHDPSKGRFWTVVEDRESYLVYEHAGEHALDMRSTFVDPAVRGRGVGQALVKEAVTFARSNGFEIIPSCWFVKRWLDREAGLRGREGDRRENGGGRERGTEGDAE